MFGLPGSPYRHGDSHRNGHQATTARNSSAGVEHLRRVGAEEEPPFKQFPGEVDRRVEEVEPGQAKSGLIAQGGGGPLSGTPHTNDHDTENGCDLSEQYALSLH